MLQGSGALSLLHANAGFVRCRNEGMQHTRTVQYVHHTAFGVHAHGHDPARFPIFVHRPQSPFPRLMHAVICAHQPHDTIASDIQCHRMATASPQPPDIREKGVLHTKWGPDHIRVSRSPRGLYVS